MRCTSCGAEVGEGRKFCSSCGTPVGKAHHCTNCGADLGPGQAFCANCGTKQVAAPFAAGAAVRAEEPLDVTPQPAPGTAAQRKESPRVAPPASSAVQRSQPTGRDALDGELKGVRPRFVAGLIDLALWCAFALSVGSRISDASASPGLGGVKLGFDWLSWQAALTYLVGLAYIVLMEGYLGWTLGKLAMGIRVVDARGKAPGPVPALLRNVARIADFLPVLYLLGIWLIASSRERQRLGDRLAGTFVVSRRGAATMRASGESMKGAPGRLVAAAVLALLLLGGGYQTLAQVINRGVPSTAQTRGQSSQPTPRPTPAPSAIPTGGGPGSAAVPTPMASAIRPPNTPAAATTSPAGGKVQSELDGAWDGYYTITSVVVTGLAQKEQRALQEAVGAVKGQRQQFRMEFVPGSADSGAVTLMGEKMPYRYQGGRLTAESPGKMAFEGRVIQRDGGYVIEGTFKMAGADKTGGLTMEGTWGGRKL